MNLIDHPKDLIFISEFFAKFFLLYARANLFPNTIGLLTSSTDPVAIFEATKIVCYFYNALKFKTHHFNFREFLETENLANHFLSFEAIRDIITVTIQASNELLMVYTSILISIVK
jgi:hypothetical protein